MAQYGSKAGMGSDPIDVRVREDKGHLGDIHVRVTGVRKPEADKGDEGPWGARGPLWFFARLLMFITLVAIISTRYWARGGSYEIRVAYEAPSIADPGVSESVFLERSEIGLVSACYKGWSASARMGPLGGEQCDYVLSGMKHDEPAWTAAVVFAMLVCILLSYQLSIEGTELFFPGFLPVCFLVPWKDRVIRHLIWLFMLLTWACFLGAWDNENFDFISLSYYSVTDLHLGFWAWFVLWLLWLIHVILIELGRI